MHTMVSQQHFAKYWAFFKTKYKKYSGYTTYFDKTYIKGAFTKWYFFDVVPNIFLTNNKCESLNTTIKRDWFNRDRKPLHLFFDCLKQELIDLTIKKNLKEFKIHTETKIRATQLEAKNIFVNKGDFNFIDKKETAKPEIAKINRFLSLIYKDVDQFKSDLFSLVILKHNSLTQSATCFCNSGLKYGICHHKLALEILKGVSKRVVMIVPKKKKGRKRKSPQAYIKEDESELSKEPQPQGKKVKRCSRPR